jgi:hypothetical protein
MGVDRLFVTVTDGGVRTRQIGAGGYSCLDTPKGYGYVTR